MSVSRFGKTVNTSYIGFKAETILRITAKNIPFCILSFCSLSQMVPCSSVLFSPETCPVLIKDQRQSTRSSPCCQGQGTLFFWNAGLQTSIFTSPRCKDNFSQHGWIKSEKNNIINKRPGIKCI